MSAVAAVVGCQLTPPAADLTATVWVEVSLAGEGGGLGLGRWWGGAGVGMGSAMVETEGEVAKAALEGEKVQAMTAVERTVAPELVEFGHGVSGEAASRKKMMNNEMNGKCECEVKGGVEVKGGGCVSAALLSSV